MGTELKLLLAVVSAMDCQLLATAMRRNGSLRVIGCVTTTTEARSVIHKHQPDIALVSSRLQDGALAGMLLLRWLRARGLPCHVIMLLDENSPELILEAFRNGARGVFCRSESIRELRKCVERVRDGQIWASNSQLEGIFRALMGIPSIGSTRPEVTTVLSKREEEIACLVASGLSNREVSKKLGLSGHTVKNYLFRIYEKFGFSTRVELAMYMLHQTKHPVDLNDVPDPKQASKRLRPNT